MSRTETLPAQALPAQALPDPACQQPSRRAVCLGLAACMGLAGCAPSTPAALPPVTLPGIAGLKRFGWDVPGLAADQFRGRISVLNVWASWCPYCRGEHDVLMRLSQDRQFALVGLVHLDNDANALAYLRKAGNPFSAVAVDASGTLSAALGQRGVPATYVIDRRARIAARLPGALSDERVRSELLPAVRLAMAAPAGSAAVAGRPG